MKIKGNEAKAFHGRLKEALKSGNTYMGYESSGQLWRSGVHFYRDQQDARNWMRFRAVHLGMETKLLPLLLVEQRLAKELEWQLQANPKQKIPNDIELDLGFLAKQEITRQQLFTDELQKKLLQEGFDASIKHALKVEILKDLPQFDINGIRKVNGKDEWYMVKVEQNQDRAFQISAIVPELEGRMEKINWKHAYYDPLEQNVEVESLKDRVLMRQIWKVVDDVQDLARTGPEGLKRSVELEKKFWIGTPMEGLVATFISEHVKESVMKENVNDENFQYLSNQLKFKGFGESLQPALLEKMKSGEKEFTLGHVPDFAKDNATATLHFKQSDNSDRYFFNRFSVQVKNDKFPDGAQQSFPVNSKDIGNTLKEAYNLLEGRPVMFKMEDKEKQVFEPWGKLNFKEVLPSGNFKMDLYNKNYGFDLDKVLSNYAIKELQTPSYKEGLMKSLERGNLQSVTFQAGVNEEKLFITPDIKLGALKIMNSEQKPVALSILTDLGYVNMEFSDQLKQRIAGFQQKQEAAKLDGPKQEVAKLDGQKVDGPKQVDREQVKPPRQSQRNKIS